MATALSEPYEKPERRVQIALVFALHGNELPGQFLDDPLKSDLAANHLGHVAGLASGYVLMLTNGLRAYFVRRYGASVRHADCCERLL